MFILKLYDRNGTELHEGDTVMISDGHHFKFFAEVKYIEAESIITPFHTFSFSSFVKVDKIPDEAIKSTEERYNIWYMPNEGTLPDVDAKEFKNYLMSWRECEDHIGKRCWGIEKIKQQQLKMKI